MAMLNYVIQVGYSNDVGKLIYSSFDLYHYVLEEILVRNNFFLFQPSLNGKLKVLK
ncbi:hypothetical protein IEQ34_002877 [Dendrobium chrysotoxum]|uniref:Uncharacterized protein n=1 Tax=Dendrobium chrysotoxum TaxID=161865 RepID=A0AAV7HI83_DENCH|nr:hypothetical protein IEQ34_002877 [Dendrobium chrysotoxum]